MVFPARNQTIHTAFVMPALLISALLSACGGGGGGAPSPSNNSPTVTGPILSSVTQNDADYTLSESELVANASDVDGDSLSVSALSVVSGDDSGISISGSDVDVSPGVYNTLPEGVVETIELAYVITDGNGGSVNTTAEIAVSGINDNPNRLALSNISLKDGQPTAGGFPVGSFFAEDPDGDTDFSYVVTGGADAASFSVSGQELLIDDAVVDAFVQDQYDVSVTVSDDNGGSSAFDLAVLVIESDPLTIGYYDILSNTGRAEQATPITAIGETAVNVGDFAVADLSGMDMLFIQNPNSSVPMAPYSEQTNLDKVEQFVGDGGVLVFHDRYVSTIDEYLPGNLGNPVQDIGVDRTQFNVVDVHTHLVNGPAGVVDDDNLEGPNHLSFGFVDAGSVPIGAIGLLSRDNENRWVTHAYPFGEGWVVYSSIPLDFYLTNGGIMRDLYAPNILAQARALLGKAPDDDGDGLYNAEEVTLGTDAGSNDSDGDSLNDMFELRNGFNPLVGGEENEDPDLDGLSNFEEQTGGTSARIPDTDGDGLDDGQEVNEEGSDPLLVDTDSDQLSDSDEVLVHMTDPTLVDTDAGGSDDGREILVDGTDPLDGSDDLGAVDLPLNLTGGAGFLWDIQRDGNINNGSSDAYDGGMRLSIDGASFPQFFVASELQDGREVRLGSASMGGLIVSRRVFVSETQAFVRYLEVLRNPTDSDIEVQLLISTNLGSDSGTILVTTSDGDTSIETTDYYVVTDDSSNGGGDPSLAHVYSGPGGAINATVTAPLGVINYFYDITVPADDRVIVMHFDSQNANRSNAIVSADYILGLNTGTLDGVTPEEQADIINFAP